MDILSQTNLRPTSVYDVYWQFAYERQNVFFSRLLDKAEPWTHDPILQKYKFTNVYRALDRVSQFLISEIIAPDIENGLIMEDKVFRILLFKLFNKIETWKLLEEKVGKISWQEYSYQVYNEVLDTAFRKGVRIYSAAYIMASGRSIFGNKRKHQNHLRLLERIVKSGAVQLISDCESMYQLYNILLSYPLIGPFLAYQYATDLNYSDITDFSEEEFVVAGPGARDGIAKCFVDRGSYTEEDMIRFMMDNQEREFDRLGLSFQTLFGRSLKLIDCQNVFCEVGKYARVSHPHILGISGRSRIKQVYRSSGELPVISFPKKWELSDKIAQYFGLIQREQEFY